MQQQNSQIIASEQGSDYNDKNPSPPQQPPKQQEKEMNAYDQLQSQIKNLQESLQNRSKTMLQKQDKDIQDLHNLHDSMEEKTSRFLNRFQQLKRKESILLTIGKIEPEVPENFPKNYYVQVIYEDINMSGNQKFVDFDENIIDEKFVLPLLSSTTVRIEIMVADQNQKESPAVFDKAEINLETEIEAALKKDKLERSCEFQNTANAKLTFTIALQGIGFQSWLKAIQAQRQQQEERSLQFSQNSNRMQKNLQKVMLKQQRFNKAFKTSEQKKHSLATKKYDQKQLNSILGLLQDDQ